MSRPGGGDNAGRWRAPDLCGWCGSPDHRGSNSECQYQGDRSLGDQIRDEEREAVKQMASLLVGKVQRPRWQRALIDALRAACRLEERAEIGELVDVFKTMNTGE